MHPPLPRNRTAMTFGHYFSTAVRTLAAKGRRNGLKIMTLAVGLSVGLVLATKVCYEQTYDSYLPGIDRIYYVNQSIELGGEYNLYTQTAGGVAPIMKEHFPQVESATRFTYVATDCDLVIRDDDRRRVGASAAFLADSCFFKVFARGILAGDGITALSVDGQIAISSSVAAKICTQKGADARTAAASALGRTVTIPAINPSLELTVGAVYEEFPANSSYRPDVLIALPTIGKITYDGSANLIGNDRYRTFLLLVKGSTPEQIHAGMPDFLRKYFPLEELKDAGYTYTLMLKPFSGYHLEDDSARGANLVLALVAFALLLTSVLNYLLIVISTSVNRSREMALRKCLGSSSADMLKMMAAESLVHGLLAAVLALAIIFACGSMVENMTGVSPSALFSGTPLLLALGILLLVLVLNSIVPARVFGRIPIAAAFRNFRESRRVWKLALLAVEFTATAFLTITVLVINRQYRLISTSSLGFATENIAQLDMGELTSAQKKLLSEQLPSLTCIEKISLANASPFYRQSGDNVSLPGEDRELFNFRDFYEVDGNYFETLGVEIVEGRPFDTSLPPDYEVIVDRSFAERMKNLTGWDDIIGKEIQVTGHSRQTMTVCGVVDGMRTQGFETSDGRLSRPMAVFYANPDDYARLFNYAFIRYHSMDEEALADTWALVSELLPDQKVRLTPFSILASDNFSSTRRTRNSILLGCIVTLFIALIGLTGYTIDEVKRRSKEIAVRRVNGAQFFQIREMFLISLMYIALPSAAVGCVLAGVTAIRWLRQFSLQAPLSWWVFLLPTLAVLATVALVSDVYVRKVAGENPAESIKTE